MIRPEKMTVKSQEALAAAHELAVKQGNGAIEAEHLLLALVDQEGGLVPALLQKIGVMPHTVRNAVESAVKRLAQSSGETAQVYMSSALNRTLASAQMEADAMKDSFVSTEHLL